MDKICEKVDQTDSNFSKHVSKTKKQLNNTYRMSQMKIKHECKPSLNLIKN